MNADLKAAGLEVLDTAKAALVSGLEGAVGRALAPEVRERIERAFGVVLEYVLEHATSLGDVEAVARLYIPEDASPELVAAMDVLAAYASAAEALARHIAEEVVKATTSAMGAVAARVALAFAKTLLASFGIPLPSAIGT